MAQKFKDKEELVEQLKLLLIESLNLADMSPEEIKPDQALFGGGLGLDSIDALELVITLEKAYGARFANSEQAKHSMASLNTLADFIIAGQKSEAA